MLLHLLPLALLLPPASPCSAGQEQGPGSAQAQQQLAPSPSMAPNANATFMYFAYGSNLLARRIHLQNPSAVRVGPALLRDYRLDFNSPVSVRWGGAPATVVPHPGKEVWGALWALNVSDRDNLDDQEGVRSGMYDVLHLEVETPGGEAGGAGAGGKRVRARSYALRRQPPPALPDALPAERQPSRVYKQVILHGARESGLPESYITALEAIPDNGSSGADPPVSLHSLTDQQL